MKKKTGLITTGIVILLVLTSASSPVLAATTIEELGHTWDNPYFAIVADVNQPTDASIHLVEDLTTETAHPVTIPSDINPDFNNQFFFSYINQSGMEVGYLALERLAKTTPIMYNRTAPFQALFTHFTNPAGADVFVVVNFDGLIAYSGGGAAARRLDPTDEIYLGVTAAGQGLHGFLSFLLGIAALRDGLPPEDFRVPAWDVEPFFEVTGDGYSFGMTYYNLLVAWLDLSGTREDEDVAKLAENLGPKVRAVSLFDNVTYRYDVEFNTNEETGITTASISANYDFGNTKMIGIGFENDPEAEDDEERIGELLKNVGVEKGLSGHVVNLTPNQPQSVMVYSDDLAKLRIRGPPDGTPGFGLAVINSALILTVGDANILKDNKTLEPDTAGDVGSVAMVVDGEKTFESDYKTKGTYDLIWANGSRRDNLPVYNTIIPTGRRGFFIPYFILQRLILVPWLLVIAKELSKQQPTEKQITAEHYFIATQFPAWSGGHIIHDPNFTAYSNPEVVPETTTEAPKTTTKAPETTTETPLVSESSLPFKLELLLSTIVGVPILLFGAKHRKKRQ
ncbi:MAG: hypothetical protein ACE5I5_15185 [Candidatus Heimdallarchaeota archaeon]